MRKFFYIDTLYSLFICLLLENNLNENFYFFSNNFSKIIAKNGSLSNSVGGKNK